jgi:hypothetical protein
MEDQSIRSSSEYLDRRFPRATVSEAGQKIRASRFFVERLVGLARASGLSAIVRDYFR